MPTRINFVGSILTECTYRRDFFLHKKLTSGKRESVSYVATFDENRRAVGMLNPMHNKNEGTYRGGEGATPVTTACPEGR